MDDKILFTATLRPETIIGATNIWLNPDIEYIEVNAEGEHWIITKEAHHNLKHQIKDLDIIQEIDPNDLIGGFVENPFTGDKLPIFPASFVSGSYGSGVVFSRTCRCTCRLHCSSGLKNNKRINSQISFRRHY